MNLQPFKSIPVGTLFRMPWTQGALRKSILEKILNETAQGNSVGKNARYVKTTIPHAITAFISDESGKNNPIMVEVIE